MKFAVLPVTVSDSPRETTLTREWFQAVMRHTANYWIDMSGGRESIEWRVFDWTPLGMTLAEKQKLNQPQLADRARDAAAAHWHVDLSTYDRFIVVLDDGVSRGGVANPHPLIGAVSATPALFQHEMGHVYGTGHANLDGPDAPVEYADKFCVMGREGAKHSFLESGCMFTDPVTGERQPQWAASGPGMGAPQLAATGWLDLGDAATAANLTAAVRSASGSAVVELAPLRGAGGPHASGLARCAVVDGAADSGDRLMIEYRARDGWDRAIPHGGAGWVVARLSAGRRGSDSVQVGSVIARPGESLKVARAPIRIDIVAADPVRDTVIVRAALDGWRAWYVHGGGQFTQPAGLAAVSRASENMDVFVVGQDGVVRVHWMGENTWREWYVLGGAQFNQTAGLAATTRTPDHMELLAVGQDGIIRGNWFLDGRWHEWYVLGGAQFTQTAALAATSRTPEHIEVLALGQDGVIRGNWFLDGRWHEWYSLGGAHFNQGAKLAAISRTQGHMEVFAVGTDGVIRGNWFLDGEWHGWYVLDGAQFSQMSGLAATSRSADHMELFAVGQDGVVRVNSFLDGGWRGWYSLGGARFSQEAHLAAVSRFAEHMELFAIGEDGMVRGDWWLLR